MTTDGDERRDQAGYVSSLILSIPFLPRLHCRSGAAAQEPAHAVHQPKRRYWMPRAAFFMPSSNFLMSSGDNCGRSILIVSLLNFAVSGNGGR